MRVLIVDDNSMTRDLLITLLQGMGHEIAGEAENGNAAIKLFTEKRPDLVLLDLIMPGKTGFDVLDEIRVIDPAARVVMVTAVQQDGISEKLIGKGAAAILHKPFAYAEFEEVLKKFA